MIPGLKAIPALNGAGSTGSGGGGSLTMSFLNYSTSTGSTVAVPTNAVAGDWAILFDLGWSLGGGSISEVTPSGWTNLASGFVSDAVEGVSIRLMTSHVTLTAGMIGTSITGMNPGRKCKIMLVFRPSTSIITKVASSWGNEVTTGNPSAQTVTASGVTTPLVVVAAAGSASGSTAFSTETPSMTNVFISSSSAVSLRVGYTLYNSSPSNQSIDMNDVNTNALQSGYVRFT